jgi:branched-subunit amino acid transport protein
MNSNFWIAFAGSVAVTYGSRLAGFYIPASRLSARSQRILGYVPIGAFTAIVVQGLTGETSELDRRIPAVLIAGLMAYFRQPLWLCLVIGFGLYLGLVHLL